MYVVRDVQPHADAAESAMVQQLTRLAAERTGQGAGTQQSHHGHARQTDVPSGSPIQRALFGAASLGNAMAAAARAGDSGGGT